MYNARDQAIILKELQDYSQLPVSKIEGTFEYDVFASNSIEFSKTEVEIEQAYKAAFILTSWGDYLTYAASGLGVERKLAVAAKGYVTVTGNGDVPAGSLFATVDGIQFRTTEFCAVKNSADIPIEATKPGIEGNVKEGLITVISLSIPGIMSVTNNAATYDGFDEELDEELKQRVLFKYRNAITSGNENHYKLWAMSVPGVGAVTVRKLWKGRGTVKVVIMDANHEPASDSLLNQVRDYIDSQRPATADVTIVAPSTKPIEIRIHGVIGTLDEDGVKKAIKSFLSTELFNGESLSTAQVGHIILDNKETGVSDYTDIELVDTTNSISASKIILNQDELPKITKVVVIND